MSVEDRDLLRDVLGTTVWRKLREAQGAMRTDVYKNLQELNPATITADRDGEYPLFAFDIGWKSIVQYAADRLATYPDSWKAKITGGKEKFGCLDLWLHYDTAQRGSRSEIERLREEVRLRSLATCDICGQPGRLRLAGFAKTVCARHAEVVGSTFRGDDGRWADPWTWIEENAIPLSPQDDYPAAAAEALKDLAPVRPRPKDHVVDLMPPLSDIGKQIDHDIWQKLGRHQDLLIEFAAALETAVVAAMNLKEEAVDEWLRSEVDRWRGVQPLSDDDREFLRRYLRSLAIDEGGRRLRRAEGMKSLERFLGGVGLQDEADRLDGRERELLMAYAGDLADSAQGSVVKEEYLDDYISSEVGLWPDILELSDDDKEWLRTWLRKLIGSEYERIRIRQSKP